MRRPSAQCQLVNFLALFLIHSCDATVEFTSLSGPFFRDFYVMVSGEMCVEKYCSLVDKFNIEHIREYQY